MELTHAYKTKDTANNLYRSGKRFLLNFINRNADVFEALTRQATPFGGNILPVRRFAAQAELSPISYGANEPGRNRSIS